MLNRRSCYEYASIEVERNQNAYSDAKLKPVIADAGLLAGCVICVWQDDSERSAFKPCLSVCDAVCVAIPVQCHIIGSLTMCNNGRLQ